MPVAIIATYYGPYGTLAGTAPGQAILTVTGLTAAQANTFSATSDGTASGTSLLPRSDATQRMVVDALDFTPTNGNGNWYETSAVDRDSSNNIRFHVTIASGGPTAFRIGVMYGQVGMNNTAP